MQQRANEALTSAAEAEQHFRRLESHCKTLLQQLQQQMLPAPSAALPAVTFAGAPT